MYNNSIISQLQTRPAGQICPLPFCLCHLDSRPHTLPCSMSASYPAEAPPDAAQGRDHSTPWHEQHRCGTVSRPCADGTATIPHSSTPDTAVPVQSCRALARHVTPGCCSRVPASTKPLLCLRSPAELCAAHRQPPPAQRLRAGDRSPSHRPAQGRGLTVRSLGYLWILGPT